MKKKIKFKNKSCVKKRFFLKKNNKIFRAKAFKKHILSIKSSNKKRKLRKKVLVHKSNIILIKKFLHK